MSRAASVGTVRRFLGSRPAVRALTPSEERGVALLGHLARCILDQPIAVVVVSKPARRDGTIENASFNRRRRELRVNLNGELRLDRPLAPRSLAILFHELAHFYTSEHDAMFTGYLEQVSGKGAALLAKEGPALAALYGL